MPRMMTVKEIANELNGHPNKVQGWCRDGVIRHTRIPGLNGYEYRFDRDDVLANFGTADGTGH